MPERILYDEAIMLASRRLKVADSELKEGEVEVITLPTTQGGFKLPWGIQGGFAVVYKFRKRSGKYCALRCFCVPMPLDIQFRYERINSYFATHIPHITVRYKYHEQGILVEETVLGSLQNRIYPLIEMDWVEGETLIETVNKLCMRRARAGLSKLADQWLALIATLQQNHIAHGDLSGVDVMVGTDGQLILVDYDGVYIPDLSTLPPLVLGKEDYQHPEVDQRKFNEQMDNFSALVIYTALLSLALQPELWDRYAYRDPQGKLLETNLLFRHEDFQDPNHSTLIRELQSINDTRLRLAVKELKNACQQPIDQVHFPFASIEPHKAGALSEVVPSSQRAGKEDALSEVIASDYGAGKTAGPLVPYLPRADVDERSIVVEMIRNQHPEHWEACYKFVQKRVFARAENLPNDFLDDIVQEIMVKIMKYLPHFRFQCTLKTWLNILIDNHIIDEYRKLRNKRSHLPFSADSPDKNDVEGLEVRMGEAVSTEDTFELREKIGLGVEALQEYAETHSNPIRDRHIIQMVIFEGKTYEEAALAAGLHAPVVGYVIREAQRYVRDKLRSWQ